MSICAATLAGCGSTSVGKSSVAESPVSESTEVVLPTSQLAENSEFETNQDGTNTGDSVIINHNQVSSYETPAPSSDPEFGDITFAVGVTDDYQPIAPGFLFTEGITEIHAVFEYSGMSPGYTWERVWHLNDREISRTSGVWTEPESGVFDYYIDNGGQPLPVGDWILELYVEGKLQSLGVFIIDTN